MSAHAKRPRIFVPPPWPINQALTLTEKHSHYLKTVLRKPDNSEVEVFDGQGQTVTGIITISSRKPIHLTLKTDHHQLPKPCYHFHIGLGISKTQAMDTAIQKTVELGVSEITPLITEFAHFKQDAQHISKKMQHWQEVIIHSAQQCHQNFIPILNPVTECFNWVNTLNDQLKLLFHPKGHDIRALEHTDTRHVTIATGPEGGFSDTEVDIAIQAGFIPIQLGTRILRADTAPICALTLAQLYWGDA